LVTHPGQPWALDAPALLRLEDGTDLRVERQLPPDLPLGYHEIQPLDGRTPQFLIHSPQHCYLAPGLRIWGWAVQLYALRSQQSWGIGDLADLEQLGKWAAGLGAGAILVNPLSAVTPLLPQQASPYYPSSRRFRNPLYLSVSAVPGAAEVDSELARWAVPARDLNQLRKIERDQVFGAKMSALAWLWRRQPGNQEFISYCREQGDSLRDFATFCVLAEQYGGDWRAWPLPYRRPADAAVLRFAQDHADRVAFHQWLQWLLDRQMAAAAKQLPLVQDLPIGVDPQGADAWQWQDVLATEVTIGAPPDVFNADGQDWGLPPFNPHRLRATRYQPIITTLRAAFRHAGGLRIDHVMGLFRLYWIPGGQGPKLGTYVRYPAEELLAIVALESHRARAWVAGEDLGTVEAEVRHRLAEQQMLSYRLLWFEDHPPRAYPELAMAAITTHDLPTVAGLWTGADFAAQQRLGLRPDVAGYRQIRERLTAVTALRDDATASEAVAQAYTALADTQARVLVANLDDALAVVERPNMPGTVQQWPNWSLALPQSLESIQAAELPRTIGAALTARQKETSDPTCARRNPARRQDS
jgi:4-alpha-glucanotransferase